MFETLMQTRAPRRLRRGWDARAVLEVRSIAPTCSVRWPGAFAHRTRPLITDKEYCCDEVNGELSFRSAAMNPWQQKTHTELCVTYTSGPAIPRAR
jgi:hypothetical protein